MLRRYLAGALVAFAGTLPYQTSAQEAVMTVLAASVADKPDTYTGKLIRVRRMRCADVDSGFTCRVSAAPFVLQVDARALADLGSTDTNTRLAGDEASARMAEQCKGEAALKSRRCEFDVVLKPVSNDYSITAQGNIVRLVSDNIDIF